jgi:hypothetical protein
MASQWIQTFALDFLCTAVVLHNQKRAKRTSERIAAAIAAHTGATRHPAALTRRGATTRSDPTQ